MTTVPGPLEQARARSRLAILPNPADPNIDPTKFVESPWARVPIPTIDPDLYENATVTIVALAELLGTDRYLSRKMVKEHIEASGQATTKNRSYPVLLQTDDGLVIIDGHHRLLALWLLGLESAPAWLLKGE